MSEGSPLPVLEIRGVHRFFLSGDDAEVAALKDISFSVGAGEFVAVVGQSGSGKSTLLNLMAGLENPDGGSVWIRGHRISHRDRTEQAAWRGSSIGVLTQGSGLLDHLTVAANVDLAGFLRTRAQRSRRAQIVAAEPDTARRRPTTAELLEGVGLSSRRDARPSTLSGGETARANLAVALAGAPDVLLADEPTAEVSRDEEMRVIELINELRPPGGATVIVTHSEAVARAAGRILELDGGVLQ
jgi:putative ABC transport system ATP-binding protein